MAGYVRLCPALDEMANGTYLGLLNVVWPSLFHGCSLCRDTKRTIESVGEWTSTSLQPREGELSTTCLPHTAGVLYKAA
jgi:hypothetical protein